MAMKSGLEDGEANALDLKSYTLHETRLKVPGIVGERSLVIVNKKS